MDLQDREKILQKLHRQIRISGHCIGVAAGSGMTARCAVRGGADFILALSAGHFRQIGLGSFSSLLCYANSNELVMTFGTRELLPAVSDTPVIFGLNATDPTINLYEYLKTIQERGFAGINNFPTIGLIDGTFRHALEQEGIVFEREVEAVRIAHFLGLFTVAFVFEKEQAKAMIEAGADVICVHLGLTVGGQKGAHKAVSLELSRMKMDDIMAYCEQLKPGIIQVVYGGPISRPEDMPYFYQNPNCSGYIGGSAFERIPVEKALTETVQAFRSCGSASEREEYQHVHRKNTDDVQFMKDYIEENFNEPIMLSDVAALLYRSVPYLSTKFKKATGYSFTEYLVRVRLKKAEEMIRESDASLMRISDAVGYRDYAQFSKIFKKYYGDSPSAYRRKNGEKREKDKEKL